MKDNNSDNFYLDDACILSNSVLDLVKNKQFKKAKTVCKRLLKEYPEIIDGFERYGLVFAAEGNKTKAIHYYLKAIKFIIENPDGFDNESILLLLKLIEDLNNGKGLYEELPTGKCKVCQQG